MLRISVTDLQRFNRFLLDADNKVSQEQLIQDTIEKSEETHQMRWGTTLHRILERPEATRFVVDSGDCTRTFYGDTEMCIDEDTLAAIMAHVPAGGVFETAKHIYGEFGGEEVCITMRADYLVGTHVHEFKSRWADATEYDVWKKRDQYESSIQAPFYAWAFGATHTRYVIFWMANAQPVTTLEHVEPVTIEATPEMMSHCLGLIEHYVAFARDHRRLYDYHAKKAHKPLHTPF